MTEREQALQKILELMNIHGLGIDDLRHAIDDAPADRPADTGADEKASVLSRVLAYLGGIFVFAGLGVFIAMNWDEMNFAARVVITLGAGISAFILGVIAVNDERYEKAATPLFLIAAVLEPIGLAVIIEEYFTGDDWALAAMAISGTIALQQILTFIKLQRTTLVFVAIAFCSMFLFAAFDWIGVDHQLTALVFGGSLLFVCVGLDKTPHAVITPFWYFVGAGWGLYGLFDLVERTAVEVLFIAAASGLVYLSTVVKSRTLLFVATIALLSYIGYFSAEHFVDAIGWPIALMLFGVVLIGLSALAFRINKRYIARQG